jgi:Acetyltransferase (GNAT) domain
MTIRVERFSGALGVRALAPAWRALTAQLPSRRHFHHVEWYLALAETLERHNLRPLFCIAVFAGDALVAVFPYREDRLQLGTHALRLMKLASDQGEGETARDFVIAPALVGGNFFQGLVKYLAEHDASWDVILLQGIVEDSLAATALSNAPKLPYFQTPGGALDRRRIEFISCGTADQPFERLSKGFRQNLRTAHNKLKCREITFETGRSESDLLRLLPEFMAVETSGWKGELGTSAHKEAKTNTFLRQLIAHLGPSGGCEIALLRADAQPIAALFGVVLDGIWYIFRIGYDEDYHRASPGHLVIESLLKRNATQTSFTTLTPYNAPAWFSAWKPDSRQIFNAYVFRPSAEGVKLARHIELFARDLNLPIVVPVRAG